MIMIITPNSIPSVWISLEISDLHVRLSIWYLYLLPLLIWLCPLKIIVPKIVILIFLSLQTCYIFIQTFPFCSWKLYSFSRSKEKNKQTKKSWNHLCFFSHILPIKIICCLYVLNAFRISPFLLPTRTHFETGHYHDSLAS